MAMRRALPSFWPLLSLFILLVLCAGCVNTPPVDGLPPVPPVPDLASLPPAPADMGPYRLQIGDMVGIKMMLNPELNDEVTVQPDGMISTSVAQDVPAYGHTTKELQADLTRLYKKQLKNPHITVVLRSFAPNRVYVLGEVAQPGEFITIGPNLTMLQAIARAGGTKNSADPNTVIILRRGEGDQPQAYVANYKAAVSGADPASDARLLPYDVVYVPRSGIADTYLNFQQYLQEFVPDSFGMSYQFNNTALSTH